MTSAIKQVVCVKWGTVYGPDYVNRMYAMLRRHLSPPFRLVCLTDQREGIRPEVECFDLPELGCSTPQNTPGKWRKQILWGREVPGLQGVALFIDLDTVIVGPLDDYFTHGDPGDVILARNWAKPLERLGQSSIFRYPVGANPQILENFRADPQGTADRYKYEQHYVTASVKGGIKFWPKPWTRHFRLHCLPSFPLRYFVQASLPRGTRVVTFPGGPNPDDIVAGRWHKGVPPHRTRWEHLKATFGDGPRAGDSRWRHLQRFLIPPDWLLREWSEA